MATTVHFRRTLCPAVDPISFEHQLDVYLRNPENDASATLLLGRVATANVGIVDGMLMADFHLDDDMFVAPDEIVVTSLIGNGTSQAGAGDSSALQLSGMVIERRWPVPTPGEPTSPHAG